MPQRIAMDLSNVKFCCGPCVDRDEETDNRSWLKPYSGGRYRKCTWLLKNGVSVDLLNIRLCRMCFDRYNDLKDMTQGQYDELGNSAMIAWQNRDGMQVLGKHNMLHMLEIDNDNEYFDNIVKYQISDDHHLIDYTASEVSAYCTEWLQKSERTMAAVTIQASLRRFFTKIKIFHEIESDFVMVF